MAENNFNFLQNIPICIEEEEELLLTALENGIADNDHGKMQRKKHASQKHSDAHIPSIWRICLALSQYQHSESVQQQFMGMQSLNIRSI